MESSATVKAETLEERQKGRRTKDQCSNSFRRGTQDFKQNCYRVHQEQEMMLISIIAHQINIYCHFIMQLQMKQTYWFKRIDNTATKQQRSRTPTYEMPDRQIGKYQTVVPDDTLKNQIKILSQKMIYVSQKFQKIKDFHTMWHQQLATDDRVIQLRCLQHNSSIILYCHEDHKLVCPNCVFSTQDHKKHQIIDASKATGFIDADLQKNEKTLKHKAANLLKSKVKWTQILENIQKNHIKSLQLLQKQHQKVAAKLATLYLKNKNKLERFFESTKENLWLLLNAFSNLNKSLNFNHSIKNVRHLFVQEVINQAQQIGQLIPNQKIGDQIYYMLNIYGQNVIKSFKMMTSQLF